MKNSHKILLTFWVGIISLIITLMHSWHIVDLSPEKTFKLDFANVIPRVDGLGVVHFITPLCSCSQSIFNHLASRGPLQYKEAKESVIVVDDNELQFTKKLKEKGFSAFQISTKELDEEFSKSIKGVPLLVIYDSKHMSRYVGGYVNKSITPFTKIDIVSYLKELDRGREIASQPVIGCAVSKKYQKMLDPFGLKYRGKIQ